MEHGHTIVETQPGTFGGYQIIHRDPETGVLRRSH